MTNSTDTKNTKSKIAAAGDALVGLLKEEATSDTPFGREFRAALVARDGAKVQALTEEFADEVVRQWKKVEVI